MPPEEKRIMIVVAMNIILLVGVTVAVVTGILK
jgi:hypothetical protein